MRLENMGEVCLSDGSQTTGAQTFEADTPVQVDVVFANCLSSTCQIYRHAECSVERSGDQVFIEGHARYTDMSESRSCSLDCVPLNATCSTDPLPAGTYTFHYGEETFQITVPSTTSDVCFYASGF